MNTPAAKTYSHRITSLGHRRIRRPVVIVCFAVLSATDALAGSGFLLRSQSTSTLGTAQAGMSTMTEDASGMIFNPALTAYLGMQAGVGLTPIYPTGNFQPSSATTILGTPIGGNSGGDSSKAGYPFNLFSAMPVSESVNVGFTLTSLFGLGFKWNDGWIGRYHAGESGLVTVDLMPSLSYRVPSRKVAFGVGMNVRYARAKTTTAIDFGTLDVLTTGGLFGGIPSANDGSLHTKLDDWGVGYTVGVVLQPTTATRLGASFRSKIKMDLKGKATFNAGGAVGQTISAVSGQFTDTDSSAPLTLPAAAIVGVAQQLSKDWLLVADAQWTQWSVLKQLKLQFANPLQADIDTQLNWRDSWFFAIGSRYQLNEHWLLRMGVAYDQTPTQRATSTPAIPDANGVWLTTGAAYRLSEASKIDFAYGHIFVKDNAISLQATAPGNALRGNLEGTIRSSAVNFVSLQYSHKF